VLTLSLGLAADNAWQTIRLRTKQKLARSKRRSFSAAYPRIRAYRWKGW